MFLASFRTASELLARLAAVSLTSKTTDAVNPARLVACVMFALPPTVAKT